VRCDDVRVGYRDRPAPVHSAVEELSLAPSMFSGTSRVDADAWLNLFLQYVDYKRLGDEQRLQLFKLLMTDATADSSRRGHTRFPRCDQEMYRPLCLQRSMQERQWRHCGTDDNAPARPPRTLRIASRIPVETRTRYGTLPSRDQKSRCTNIEEVMEAAKLAEATTDQTSTTADRLLLQQLADQVFERTPYRRRSVRYVPQHDHIRHDRRSGGQRERGWNLERRHPWERPPQVRQPTNNRLHSATEVADEAEDAAVAGDSPSRVWGGAPAEIDVILAFKYDIWWQHV